MKKALDELYGGEEEVGFVMSFFGEIYKLLWLCSANSLLWFSDNNFLSSFIFSAPDADKPGNQ